MTNYTKLYLFMLLAFFCNFSCRNLKKLEMTIDKDLKFSGGGKYDKATGKWGEYIKVKNATTLKPEEIFIQHNDNALKRNRYWVNGKVKFNQPVTKQELSGTFEGKNATKVEKIEFFGVSDAESFGFKVGFKEWKFTFDLETDKTRATKKDSELKEEGTITIKFQNKKTIIEKTHKFEYLCADKK